MARCIVPDAEKIIDQEFKVLDQGFVRLVDYMGGDQRIVQAARVSYGEGTRTVRQDAGLIDYLLRNKHTSPFEQVVMTFHIKMPVFVARQWIRHRTARINEVSGRYSIMPDEFFSPAPDTIAQQSENNKQGRKQEPVSEDEAATILKLIEDNQKSAYETYQKQLEMGTARELARIVLPLSLYTELYWQIDLHNLFHFLQLRLDQHAQLEICQYATVIRELASRVCPLAFESFDRHYVGAVQFSGEEMSALSRLLDKGEHGLKGKAADRFLAKLGRNNTSGILD